MTLPSILFAVLIALFYGALYHVVRAGGGWRILLYLGVSVLGFMAGQLIGDWRGWHFLLIGRINLGMGTVFSALFLALSEWLSRIETKRESSV